MTSPSPAHVLEEGMRAWPGVHLDPEQVKSYLEASGPHLVTGSSSRAADLYLVCACLQGNAKALCYLETMCREQLRFVASSLRAKVDEDDVVGAMMARMAVASGNSPPSLTQYVGRSDLRRWIEIGALRQVLDRARRQKTRDRILEETLLTESFSERIQTWRGLDESARRIFKEALGKALADLSPRDRNLLRLRLGGTSVTAIAALHNVQRRTLTRWLERINATVEHAVRRELRLSLRVPHGDLDSLVHSLLSQVDTSIRYQLAAACGEGAK
jgi:RNA polymerase sigma-70 factor